MTKKQPSAHARQLVHDAFDADKLIDICERDDFSDYADYFQLEDSPWVGWDNDGNDIVDNSRFYWYKDNGSKILAIAHLDTVQPDRTCQVTETAGGLLATSGGLDDRLGAYVILEMLPALGVNVDWLLTTDEEMGQSTASDFVTDKDYNWMIQFDRGGTDVVMYQYETDEAKKLVQNCGARLGNGIYSDIADMGHLGIAGFNWGVGYQDYHGVRAHAWLEDTFRNVARFVKFHRANADTKMPFVRRPPRPWGQGSSYPSGSGYYENLHRALGSGEDVDNDDLDDMDGSGSGLDLAMYESYITADCSHVINLDNESTYMEFDKVLVCRACGEEVVHG